MPLKLRTTNHQKTVSGMQKLSHIFKNLSEGRLEARIHKELLYIQRTKKN